MCMSALSAVSMHLDVAVDDALGVEVVERAHDLHEDGQDCLLAERPVCVLGQHELPL